MSCEQLVRRQSRRDRDYLRLVSTELDLALSFEDSVVGESIVAAYSDFVDIRPGRAQGGRTLECIVAPAALDLLLHCRKGLHGAGCFPQNAALRTAGAGSSGSVGVSMEVTGRSVLVLGALDLGSRSILEREIRMLFTRQLVGRGWAPLHAAGLVGAAGRAVLLMGPKMAGKTTTLLRLLRTGTVGLMANDKLFVKCQPGQDAQVRSLPVAAGLRATTLELFPELAPLSSRRGALHVDNVRSVPAADQGKLFAPIQAIANTFSAPIIPEAPLGAIVVVRFGADHARTRVRRVRPDELGALITTERLDRNHRWREEWLGALDAADVFPDEHALDGLATATGFRLDVNGTDNGALEQAFAEIDAIAAGG